MDKGRGVASRKRERRAKIMIEGGLQFDFHDWPMLLSDPLFTSQSKSFKARHL
jgi:hypothetical protein